MKMPNCPRCEEDELGAISMWPDGPRVLCYRCGWSPEPEELPADVRVAAESALRREADAKLPTCRADDMALLAALLADDVELREDQRAAFEDMREKLGTYWTLTVPQRKFLIAVAERLAVDTQTPAERNANVPRGREVVTPQALSRESLQRALATRRRP